MYSGRVWKSRLSSSSISALEFVITVNVHTLFHYFSSVLFFKSNYMFRPPTAIITVDVFSVVIALEFKTMCFFLFIF
jgi:hypothetical protein